MLSNMPTMDIKAADTPDEAVWRAYIEVSNTLPFCRELTRYYNDPKYLYNNNSFVLDCIVIV